MTGLANVRYPARPNVFEDLAVTARPALVLNATSSGLAAAGVGHGKAVISRRAGGHDRGVADDGGADWAGYYAWSAGRAPRPLLLASFQELGAGRGRLAIDLGCGEGTDSLELLARGWSVLAVDAEPAGLALLRARITPAAAGRIRILWRRSLRRTCRART